MKAEDLLDSRLRDLFRFFKGYYGKAWRKNLVVRDIMVKGMPDLFFSVDQRDRRLARCYCVTSLEEHATGLGYRPVADEFAPPFERNRIERLRCVILALSNSPTSRICVLTIGDLLRLFFSHHRKADCAPNGLIPPQSLVIESHNLMIPNQQVPLKVPVITLSTLLSVPPDPEMIRKGGHYGTPIPLSGPSAHKKNARGILEDYQI